MGSRDGSSRRATPTPSRPPSSRCSPTPLGGSVELAAVLELTSHVIDLVETGETVRVHKLEIQDLVKEISPRLIVGKNAYRTRAREMRELIARIEDAKHEILQNQLP